MSQQRLLAEWEPQDAVLLTWPHEDTDWAWILPEVTPLYEALATVISDYAHVVIAAPPAKVEAIQQQLLEMGIPAERLHIYPVLSNDTWARDHGPLTVTTEEGGVKLLDFTFTGWGNKYKSDLDNAITRHLHKQNLFGNVALERRDLVLEGGAIEVDEKGTLLTTEACLLNPNRNPHLKREDIEQQLREDFGVRKINWLRHGYLAGDDTDSHIDTLARLCPNNVIAYVRCDDESDEHYQELSAMEAELQAMTDADGEPYTLVPLPWPSAKYSRDDEEKRLPATYANFLIINGAVLVPLYDDFNDDEALAQVSVAFPDHHIMGIPCSLLIEQHGSLHCITMQLPKGTLRNP